MALAASGCAKEASNICITPPTLAESVKEPHDTSGAKSRLDGCVQRWATRLAGAPGSNTEIARAVVGGCLDSVDQLIVSQAIDQQKAGSPLSEQQELEWRKDDIAQAESFALFQVAVARAGKCPTA
jgi:hypothetical protein